MLQLHDRPKPKRRQVERLNAKLIEVALNKMPGVWASVNNTKRLPFVDPKTGKMFVTQGGLGIGSADIIFSVALFGPERGEYAIARIGWLECKTERTRTKRVDHAARDEHQVSWADAMRRKGHFVAHGVVTVEEAVAAVQRCARGEMR